MICGFLPPHGRELANNEEFTVFGNILDAVAQYNGDRVTSRRHITAFATAISEGDIVIVHTPAPIFKDATSGAIKMARTNSGTLGIADPCWANAGSVVDDGSGGNPYDG